MNHAIALELLPEARPLRTDTPDSAIAPETYVTLSHRGWLDVGGARYRIVGRAARGGWNAARLERDRLSANFQGNPLWPARVLADYPALSAHFGLSGSSSDRACLLPATSTINRDLGRLMPESDFRFREGADLSTRAYVDAFIDDRTLPMADVAERDSIHDWSYHFLTFLFSEYLEDVRASLDFVRERLHHFRGPTAYAWNYYGHHLDERGAMRGRGVVETLDHDEAVYRQMAIALDVATAKLVQLLRLEQEGMIDKCRGELEAVAVFLGGPSRASIAKILWLEPTLPFDAPERRTPAEDVLRYVKARLAGLEKRAATWRDPVGEGVRERLFRDVLDRV